MAAAVGPFRLARPCPREVLAGRLKHDRFFFGRGPAGQFATNLIGRLALDTNRHIGTGQVQWPLPLRNFLRIAKHVGVAQFPLAGGPRNARDHLVVDGGKPPPEELQVERGPLEIGRDGEFKSYRVGAFVGRFADVTRVRRVFQKQCFGNFEQTRSGRIVTSIFFSTSGLGPATASQTDSPVRAAG